MELILDETEVSSLLKIALADKGVFLKEETKMSLRCNHKEGTFKVVFTVPATRGERKTP